MLSISVVIPTRDRATALIETLEAWRPLVEGAEPGAAGAQVEVVVVDLGSRDGTPDALDRLAAGAPWLRWCRLEGTDSAAAARNRGAAEARNELLLFLADTLRPADTGVLRAHAEVHERFPAPGTAVTGPVGWAERPGAGDLPEPLPPDAAGQGGAAPYAWRDWRAARPLNLSLRRDAVGDWATDGFAVDLAPEPDGGSLDAVELAHRLSRTPAGLRLFHTPAALVRDARGWSPERLMARQAAAGGLVHALVARADGPTAADLGLGAVAAALRGPGGPGDPAVVADYLAMLEGAGAWARLFDASDGGAAGPEALKPALALAFARGYVLTAPAGSDMAAGCRAALDGFRQRLNRMMQTVATGLPASADAGAAAVWRVPRPGPLGRLRAWARQKPTIVRAYLWLRAVQGR
ncbi:glycosyltransferase [Azospirillum halopraeferens]|uniref:glycosyltransferase n=1 Tax=Azospirillum halopraeferens TaxID=34010 RepID=UPI0003F8C66F|nr:glycosyltransferase [Azospirillum halopraeferens]